jgi:hypothetical protein
MAQSKGVPTTKYLGFEEKLRRVSASLEVQRRHRDIISNSCAPQTTTIQAGGVSLDHSLKQLTVVHELDFATTTFVGNVAALSTPCERLYKRTRADVMREKGSF